jgi:uncharacterized protein with von Willebrand factor type A (vWA) domain
VLTHLGVFSYLAEFCRIRILTASERRVKKFDLEKNKGLKLANDLKQSGVATRFGQQAAQPKLDKREQRRLDQEQGLVPFACKLDSELVKQLQEKAATHEGGMSALLADLLVAAGLKR